MDTKVDEFLAHFGIKGMKWGVRRSDAQLARASTGQDTPDGIRAKETLARINSSKSLTSVSNSDLEFLNKRLELEKKFADVNPSGLKAGHARVKTVLDLGKTANEAIMFYNSPAGRLLRNVIGLSKHSGNPTQPYGRHAKPIAYVAKAGKKKK